MPTKLGQNFLKDREILEKILQAAKIKPSESVLEIGPGDGVLTQALSKLAKRVVAVEIDGFLVKKIAKIFENNSKIKIINADILKIHLEELAKKYNLEPEKYKVVANIPYYITSSIIRLFLEAKIQPKNLIFMVQKEVAERIVAKKGEMSLLSVSVQYYSRVEKLFNVSREAFYPQPEVESAIIKITPKKNHPKPEEAKKFFRVVRAGFSAKRKTLLNNLANSLHFEKDLIEKQLKKAGLKPLIRAQELSLGDWEKLVLKLEKIIPKKPLS